MNLHVLSQKEATLITPEVASDLLALNKSNRRLRKNRVKHLAGVLKRGEWVFNGEPLQVGTNGNGKIERMYNRQHTLTAIIESGVAAELLVVAVSPEAMKTLDQTLARSFADYLYMQDETNVYELAASVRRIWAWENGRGIPSLQNVTGSPTIEQCVECLEQHPGIRVSIERVEKMPFLTGSVAATHHYLFSLVDPEDADEFFRLLHSGEGLQTGNPVLALRERLIAERSKATGQLHLTVISAFLHRAFKAYRAGESLAKLRFTPGGATPDRFPVIRRQADGSFDFA